MNEQSPRPFGHFMARRSKRKGLDDKLPLHVLTQAEYTGRSYKRITQLNKDLLLSIGDDISFRGIHEIDELDDISCDFNYNRQKCLFLLKMMLSNMTNFEARRNPDASSVDEDEQCHYGNLFMEYGGVDALVRLMMQNCLLPQETTRGNKISSEELCIKSLCLELLCRLVSLKGGVKLAEQLGRQEDLLSYLFTLLVHDQTFVTACQLIEDMLQSHRQVLNLTDIENIRTLLVRLDDKKLANFCRILAVTISDLDIYENKSSLFAQNKQKRSKGFINIRDINQEMLLGIPDLLPRLVQIAVSKEYNPRYPNIATELDSWMVWIENSMIEESSECLDLDDLENYIGGVSTMSSDNGPLSKQSGLQISTDLVLRVQVVYVLGLFLVGKHRKKVQKKLAELNLIPGLCDLFDQFIWKCQSHRNNSRNRLRGHNASCECSPEVALKIQFLRLVHSFCDHSDYKHLLLSRLELSDVKKINSQAGMLQVDGIDSVNKSQMCRGAKGLLSKIVEVMKKEPTASTFRFWLARAVESYLRGTSSYCDQVFLLSRGLLEHIAGNIVEHDVRPKEILQSSFDLLGEMVKFNVDSFRAFDKILNTDVRFHKFLATMQKNLVDSNMFIRALVLSLEHVETSSEEHKYRLGDSRLLHHVSRFETQMEYLQRLINLISVHNLTQENVSCLNTTLVMLMFARRKKLLPHYIQGLLRDWSSKSSSGSQGALHCVRVGDDKILRNFRDLLLFWQDHYLHKDKDCSALERSSRISFDYWKATVGVLVSDLADNPSAIVHYFEPDFHRDS